MLEAESRVGDGRLKAEPSRADGEGKGWWEKGEEARRPRLG